MLPNFVIFHLREDIFDGLHHWRWRCILNGLKQFLSLNPGITNETLMSSLREHAQQNDEMMSQTTDVNLYKEKYILGFSSIAAGRYKNKIESLPDWIYRNR